MKPVKIRLSQGDLRAQGMYILLDADEEKYTKMELLHHLIELIKLK